MTAPSPETRRGSDASPRLYPATCRSAPARPDTVRGLCRRVRQRRALRKRPLPRTVVEAAQQVVRRGRSWWPLNARSVLGFFMPSLGPCWSGATGAHPDGIWLGRPVHARRTAPSRRVDGTAIPANNGFLVPDHHGAAVRLDRPARLRLGTLGHASSLSDGERIVARPPASPRLPGPASTRPAKSVRKRRISPAISSVAPKHVLAEIRDDFHRVAYAANADAARAAYATFETEMGQLLPGYRGEPANTIERLHEEFSPTRREAGMVPDNSDGEVSLDEHRDVSVAWGTDSHSSTRLNLPPTSALAGEMHSAPGLSTQRSRGRRP